MLDPCVRALVEHDCFGAASVAHLWRVSLRDLERWALPALDREYLDNRRFWDDLLTVLVNLALSTKALETLPAQGEWEDLFALLRTTAPLRNIAPKSSLFGSLVDVVDNDLVLKSAPFGPFLKVSDFGELFIAQRNAVTALRGSDVKAAEGEMPGANQLIPRSTFEDVSVLLKFWTSMLNGAKEIDGRAPVVKLWKQANDEFRMLWKEDRKNETYPQNNTLWRILRRVSTHIAVADETPSRWDLLKEKADEKLANLPETVSDAGKAVYGGAKAVVSGTADFILGIPGAIGGALNKMSLGLLKGLLGPYGPYVVLGGGLLGGYLLLRRPDGRVVMVPNRKGGA